MSNPEVITVNSEALEAQIRDLLPSQRGFGSELQATNVITPIIDLTGTAEGSSIPEYMQTAIALGSNTPFAISNATATIVSNTGFHRIIGVVSINGESGGNREALITMTDGVSTSNVWSMQQSSDGTLGTVSVPIDLTFFSPAGVSITGTTNDDAVKLFGSVRQVATVTGELVNPNGFVLE
jgi:hypothetical protein